MADYKKEEFLSGLAAALIQRTRPFFLQDFGYYMDDNKNYYLTSWKGTLGGEPSNICSIPNNPKVVLDLGEEK